MGERENPFDFPFVFLHFIPSEPVILLIFNGADETDVPLCNRKPVGTRRRLETYGDGRTRNTTRSASPVYGE